MTARRFGCLADDHLTVLVQVDHRANGSRAVATGITSGSGRRPATSRQMAAAVKLVPTSIPSQ
jgi:hypothetical protein